MVVGYVASQIPRPKAEVMEITGDIGHLIDISNKYSMTNIRRKVKRGKMSKTW